VNALGLFSASWHRDEQNKTKGERASPKEIEDMLCALESVAWAAAVGIPDELSGEAIKCFIVYRPGTVLAKKNILRHC
jgi:long-chain acyl-CoA synthetase